MDWDKEIPDGIGVLLILGWALFLVCFSIQRGLIVPPEHIRELICEYQWNPADATEDPWKCTPGR
jgi:hypothetical protein